MTTISRRRQADDQVNIEPYQTRETGPTKREMKTSQQSLLSADTGFTPPRTPSPSADRAIASVKETLKVDIDKYTDQGREGKSIRKARSAERTRHWAEEVSRERDGIRPKLGKSKSRLEQDGNSWAISTIIIDALVDQLDPYSPSRPLKTADEVIANLSRKTRYESNASSGSDSLPPILPNRFTNRDEAQARNGDRDKVKKTQSRSKNVTLVTSPNAPPVPTIAKITKPKANISSIDDIVKRHAGAANTALENAKDRARRDLGLPSPIPSPHSVIPSSSSDPTPSTTGISTDTTLPKDAHVKVPTTIAAVTSPQPETVTSSSIKDTPARSSVDSSSGGSVRRDMSIGQALLDKLETGSIASSHKSSRRATPHSSLPPLNKRSTTPSSTAESRKSLPALPGKAFNEESHAMALYLRSPRLNRFLHLPRPFPERPLRVSLADVGATDGYPVVMFLGIGCVRHLVALFDDFAKALNLRLICIDRWGFGQTSNVPLVHRNPFDWAFVVERVLDDIGVDEFRIIAHSAGAPYAGATALHLKHRVKGKLQLLAPWINADIDGGYKWLKWVPDGIIKSAFAAEWKLTSYRLGKPPPLVHRPISSTFFTNQPDADDRLTSTRDLNVLRPLRQPSLSRRASQILHRNRTPVGSTTSPATTLRLKGYMPSAARSNTHMVPSEPSFESDQTALSSIHLKSPETSFNTVGDGLGFDPTSSNPSIATADKPPTDAALFQALEQASHAECEPGTTDDLMAIILNRPSRSWGFSYADLDHPATIWWGSEDERISEKSVRWVERVMPCGTELKVVQGADHNLMRRVPVMCEVFQTIADEVERGYRR